MFSEDGAIVWYLDCLWYLSHKWIGMRGGALVKILRWYLVLIFLGLSSSVVLADSVDPKFVPIGGTGSIILTSPTDPAFTFSFTQSPSSGTVDCGTFGGPSGDACINPLNTEFVNDSGKTWNSITLVVTQQSAGLLFTALNNAIDPYFASSSTGTEDNGDQFVTFSGIDADHPGIESAFSCPDGPDTCTGPIEGGDDTDSPEVLLYDFSILADVSDMANGQSFTVQGFATTVPEPPAVLLALGGGLLLILFKRSS